jgi:polysaccharide export outer membrane protein
MNRLFALLSALLALILVTEGALAQNGAYQIRPGDVLRVEVLEDSGLNREALVTPDGRVALPLAGGVSAAGRTIEEVQGEIRTRLAPNFATAPTVFVSLARVSDRARGTGVRAITVHVLGEAAKTGKLELRAGTTILQAFSEMGGFSRFAATRRVQLRRVDASGTERVYTFDYNAMERGAVAGGQTVLAEGDVIVIPQRRLFE